MKRVVPTLVLLLLAASTSGCWKLERLPGKVDRLAFQYLGGTLFENPETLTLKEIHLGNGALAGRQVIIEGKVAEVSSHATYLVLADDTARLLVVLTDLETAEPLVTGGRPQTMRVLGTVEAGKKGLPFVKASAVSVAKEPALGVDGKA